MANKFRGESELIFMRDVDGEEKEAKFKLVFDANAFCEIEDITGMGLGELHDAMTDPKKLSMKTVRAMLYGGLSRHHAEGLTVEEAGDIMSDAGMDTVLVAMQQAFGSALPKAKVGERTRQKVSGSRGTGKKP